MRERDVDHLDVLLVEDDEEDYLLTKDLLSRLEGARPELHWVSDYRSALTVAQPGEFDVCLVDYRLGPNDGIELVRELVSNGHDVPVIVLTGQGDRDVDLEATRAGAADYLVKGEVSPASLERAIRYAMQRHADLRALRESEARKTAMLDSALDGVITIDHEGRIVDFNRAAETIFGHDLEAVSGKQLAELIIPPSLRRRHKEAFARYLATGESTILGTRLELTAMRADGSEFPVELSITGIDLAGKPFFTGYVRDISDRRRAEEERARLAEQLRQSQKMEAIGNLAGGIAHDFNNVLMVIRTCGALLLKRLGDEQLRKNVLQIDGAAQRGAALTHQLLAFSRHQALRPETTDLNAVVQEALDLLQRLIGENIEIVCELEPEPESIVVDRGQLGQVLLNLAVNARDAMVKGGTLTIRTAKVVLDEIYASEHLDVAPGAYMLLQVTDSGAGMDEETRSRAFDPFFTTKEAGTGLGLATVYGIVKQSGGHIWLYSEPGMGTTFKIYFPRVSAPARTTTGPGEVYSLDGHETILLVEDEEPVRPLIAGALRGYGYTVLEAANGAEALRIVEQQRGSIGLVLTDVVMPGMNGRELAETLVAEQPNLKVLFTSGYPADTIIRHGIAHASADYIEKPYLPEDLARKIREVLDLPR